MLLHHRKRLALISVGILIFLFLGSRSTKSPDYSLQPETTPYRLDLSVWPTTLDNDNEQQQSAFASDMFTVDGPNSDLKAVTAVIYRISQDPDNIVRVVHHLLRYPFIREIYIHNPMTRQKLTVEQLELDINKASHINIEIFDEKNEHLGSFARFTTCAMASFTTCFMQDDTWINQNMDALYLNMIRFPALIHANSPPTLYLDQARRRFYNSVVSMHSGYVDLQYGSFLPRTEAQTFLTKMGKSSLGKDRIRLADIYFALWTNQYPWILENPIHSAAALNESTINQQPSAEWSSRVYSNILQATRRMQRTLEADLSDAPKDFFERLEERPMLGERDARASCTNDRCLFITNMDFMPDPSNLIFNRTEVTTIPDWEKAYNTLGNIPTHEFFAEHAYHMAVDQDPNTCWNTFEKPKKGDYFGLILMGDIRPELLQIYTCNDIQHAEGLFNVEVSKDGNDWIACKTKSTAGWHHVPPRLRIGLDCGQDVESIRAIRISFLQDGPEPFNVCGLGLDSFVV